jgi:hypothetical protein
MCRRRLAHPPFHRRIDPLCRRRIAWVACWPGIDCSLACPHRIARMEPWHRLACLAYRRPLNHLTSRRRLCPLGPARSVGCPRRIRGLPWLTLRRRWHVTSLRRGGEPVRNRTIFNLSCSKIPRLAWRTSSVTRVLRCSAKLIPRRAVGRTNQFIGDSNRRTSVHTRTNCGSVGHLVKAMTCWPAGRRGVHISRRPTRCRWFRHAAPMEVTISWRSARPHVLLGLAAPRRNADAWHGRNGGLIVGRNYGRRWRRPIAGQRYGPWFGWGDTYGPGSN